MTIYNVSFEKNDVYQSHLVKTEKSPVEIAQYYRDIKKAQSVLGVYLATKDDYRPSKPLIEI